MIISKEVNMFREMIRHIWNIYLRKGADWETIDTFRSISRILFINQISSKLGIDSLPIPVDSDGEYLSNYKLFMEGNGKLPLSANREIPPGGYWDYPVQWIPSETDYEIRPISFFDYDMLGWRLIEYYRARVVNCKPHPELTGRDVLIRCDHVDIEVTDR